MLILKLRHLLRKPADENGEQGGDSQTRVASHPKLTGRNAAMEQISAQADSLVANEFADFDEETGTAIPREPVPEVQPEPEPDDSVIMAPPEPEADPEPQKPRMVPIVVDGQTIEVDEQRIIEAGKRTLQKESAADRRLQEANEILNRARAQATRVSQDPAQHQPAPSQDAQAQPTQQATNGLNDPATLINVIRQSVTTDVMESIRAQQAVETFRSEFPDISGDDNLWQIACQLEDKRLREAAALGEPIGDALQAYRKHGEEIRKWVAKFAPAPAVNVPDDKVERKRTITAIPAVNAKAPAPQPPKQLTVSEEIERMRQERRTYGRPIRQPVPR